MLCTSIKGYKGSPRIKRAAVLFNTHGFIDARHAMLAVGYTPEEASIKEKRRTIRRCADRMKNHQNQQTSMIINHLQVWWLQI